MSCGFWDICEDGDSGLGGSFLLGAYSLADIFTDGDRAARFYASERAGGDAEKEALYYGAATEAFVDVNYFDFMMTTPNAATNWAADFTFGNGGAEYVARQKENVKESGLAGLVSPNGNPLPEIESILKWAVVGAGFILAIKVIGLVK